MTSEQIVNALNLYVTTLRAQLSQRRLEERASKENAVQGPVYLQFESKLREGDRNYRILISMAQRVQKRYLSGNENWKNELIEFGYRRHEHEDSETALFEEIQNVINSHSDV